MTITSKGIRRTKDKSDIESLMEWAQWMSERPLDDDEADLVHAVRNVCSQVGTWRAKAHGKQQDFNLAEDERIEWVKRGERAEEKLRELIEVAHKHGWNGVTNSKILSSFFDQELEQLQALALENANMKELLRDWLAYRGAVQGTIYTMSENLALRTNEALSTPPSHYAKRAELLGRLVEAAKAIQAAGWESGHGHKDFDDVLAELDAWEGEG